MSELLTGKFKCNFGVDVCESVNLYITCSEDKNIWKNILDLSKGYVVHNFSHNLDEIMISTENHLDFLEDKLKIYSSKYNIYNKSKNNVHISVLKSEVCFENLDIYDEDGFHLYNAKNVQVVSKEKKDDLFVYKLKADWIQGLCNSKCKYWRQVENSLPSIF